jgi:hypothetical protein
MQEDVNIKLQYHSSLNQKIWQLNNKIRPELRQKLLQFGKTWQVFAGIPNSAVTDVILTGGNANYNYTPYSDLDVHLLVDKSKLTMFGSKLDDQLMAKKQLWTLTHNVTVLGYPLEPYAQDNKAPFPKGQGVYSLKKDAWIQEPVFQTGINFKNDPRLKQKVQHYMDLIDDIIKHKMGMSAVDAIKTKLWTMRNAAISKGGEFSFENLVYKELRNQGYLDKLSVYAKTRQDKKLSLK